MSHKIFSLFLKYFKNFSFSTDSENHLLDTCLSSLVCDPTRAEIVWLMSALYPHHLDDAGHRTCVGWNLQEEGRQAGGKGDGPGVAESGSKPRLPPGTREEREKG